MPKPLTIILTALICCACTAPQGDDAEESERPQTGYEQSLEKARDVEDQVLEAAEQQKRAIDEQSDGG